MCKMFGGQWKAKYQEQLNLHNECRAKLYLWEEKHESLQEHIYLLETFIEDMDMEPPPALFSTIEDADWVYLQLVAMLNKVGDTNMVILPLVDDQYKILDEENFMSMANWIWTSEKEYVPTFYDCDDYIYHFIALAARFFEVKVGGVIDYSSSHAYGAPVLVKGAAIYEPQNRDLITVIGNRIQAHYGLKDGYIQI